VRSADRWSWSGANFWAERPSDALRLAHAVRVTPERPPAARD